MTIGHVARLENGRQDRRAERIAAPRRSTMLDRSGRLLNGGEPVDRRLTIVMPFHRRTRAFHPWRANAAAVSPVASTRCAGIVAHGTALSGFRDTTAQRTFPRSDPEHTTMAFGLNESLVRLDEARCSRRRFGMARATSGGTSRASRASRNRMRATRST
ncbi:hypothetical protein [Burkholderia sp. MSMB1072]|uniref:hypothetical protein n=1 Tax=Burkholderia sp. MSMB1072 TaxID=1637871 RepID=UPI00211D5D51|nr:hypothetical protein [Burkholderia sp. MSMB1072]